MQPPINFIIYITTNSIFFLYLLNLISSMDIIFNSYQGKNEEKYPVLNNISFKIVFNFVVLKFKFKITN